MNNVDGLYNSMFPRPCAAGEYIYVQEIEQVRNYPVIPGQTQRFMDVTGLLGYIKSQPYDPHAPPTSPQDMDYAEKLTRALLNITKTLKIKDEMEYGMPMGAMGNRNMYGEMYPMGATSGAFNGGWDSYGAQQRDSRGRYMDDEMMASVRDIMSRTSDERTRDDLRRILERR